MMLRSAAIACLFTLCVEVPVVAGFYRGQRTKMAITALLSTSTTNLAMNLILLPWATSVFEYLVLGETAAVLVEAAVYWRVDRARRLDQALIASALANSASFLLGLPAMRILLS